jgi:hypothetical protein
MFEHRVTTFMNFLGHLAYDLHLHPGTVRVYKCAVINWFKQRWIEHEFMGHPAIQQLMASLMIHWNASNEVAEKRRLPFTLEMHGRMRTDVLDLRKVTDRATLMGVEIALVLMLRQSELIPSADKHYVREDDVQFTLRCLKPGEPDVTVPARKAYLFNPALLTGVTIHVRSAKNDQEGHGNRYHFGVLQLSPVVSFCLASNMLRWATEARLQPGDPFLAYRGEGATAMRPWWLSYNRLNNAIKATASLCGFNCDLFSTHSLRIGGATILAAAGLPNHYIQKMGRWKSLTFLTYIHVAMGVMDESIKAVVRPGLFTNAQLRVLNNL